MLGYGSNVYAYHVFNRTSIDPIYAYTESPNLLSKKVLLKAGFMPNGNKIEGNKEVSGFVLSKENYLKRKK